MRFLSKIIIVNFIIVGVLIYSADADEFGTGEKIVDLSKPFIEDLAKPNNAWIGKTVNDIINDTDINHIIVTKWIASAPVEAAEGTIQLLLKENPKLEAKIEKFDEAILYLEAILILKNRGFLKLRLANIIGGGESLGCITSTEGSAYFRAKF